jgi:hypothetical protein
MFSSKWLVLLLALQPAATVVHEIPAQLQGDWVITRVIPTRTVSCWGQREANSFVGTTVHYGVDSLHWKRYLAWNVAVTTRNWTREQFQQEYYGGTGNSQLDFVQLGVKSRTATVVRIQHDAANLTGGTTEIPGDWAY